MAGQSSALFGWSWTEVSVLGSQVFRCGLMESCDIHYILYKLFDCINCLTMLAVLIFVFVLKVFFPF